MKKEIISAKILGIDWEELMTGKLDVVIKRLSTKKKKLESLGWKKIQTKVQQSYEYCELEFIGERIETDSEFSTRIKEVEKNIEKQKIKIEKEKEKYLKLKKKFG